MAANIHDARALRAPPLPLRTMAEAYPGRRGTGRGRSADRGYGQPVKPLIARFGSVLCQEHSHRTVVVAARFVISDL